MKLVYSLCLVSLFKYSANQYVTLNRKPSKGNTCDSSNRTALVEHFFNIIFAEFHSTPPVCVCVQMCIDQSTYCYPNGCFKIQNKQNKRIENLETWPRTASDDEKPIMFVVDEKNDFITDFFKKIDINEPRVVEEKRSSINDMRPDPFKDRYKMIYKYKKVPKVELRYNLREQVKNTKSDVLKIESMDVSKTRWPLNKDKRVNPKKIYSELKKPKNNANFFLSVHPNNDETHYPSKYFKRDLSTKGTDEVNIKALYIVEKKDASLENANFSIETLINNLIESTFDRNETDEEPKFNNDLKEHSDRMVHYNTSKNERYDRMMNVKERLDDVILTNKSVLSNNTNDNSEDIFQDTVNNKTKSFKEMIASLSKRIEQQNNTSMAIMKKVIGGKVLNNIALLDPERDTEITTIAGATVINSPTVTEDTPPLINYSKMKTTRKSRQRMSRKLHNSKMN